MPKGARASSSPAGVAPAPAVGIERPDGGEEAPASQEPRPQPRRFFGREGRAHPGDEDDRAPGEGLVRAGAGGVDGRELVVVLLEEVAESPEALALVVVRLERQLAVAGGEAELRLLARRARCGWPASGRAPRGASRARRRPARTIPAGSETSACRRLATTMTASVATRPSSVRPASRPKRACSATSCATSRSGSIVWTSIRDDAASVRGEELLDALLERIPLARDGPDLHRLLERVERLDRRRAERPAPVPRPVPAREVPRRRAR